MAESLPLAVEMLLERVMFNKAISTMGHLTSLMVNVREEVKFLREILPKVRDLVFNVTDHDNVPDTTKTFLRALSDFVYDAEDILDEFDTEISRRRWKNNRRKQRNMGGAPSHDFPGHGGDARKYPIPKCLRLKIGKQIKDLYQNIRKNQKVIRDVRRNNDIFELRENIRLPYVNISDSSTTRWLSQSRPVTVEVVARDFMMVGREDVKGRIIEKLLNITCRNTEVGRQCRDSETCPDCSNRPLVLLITGMGGLGKTTLAKDIFHDPQIIEHFKSFRKWVHVGKMELNPLEVMGMIMGKHSLASREELREELDGKKFLIVLDDVWKGGNLRESWSYLRVPLSYGGKGSRMIITTREEAVKHDLVGMKVEVERLLRLIDEECMHILERCAFPFHGAPVDEKLKEQLMEIGQKIVHKVGGVPLAAVVIGSSLRGKWNELFWQNALHQVGLRDVSSVFMLSYRRLPSQLKQCFTFLSLFPKGSPLEKMKIVQMWIAHGYVVQLTDGIISSLEDIAEQYLDQLAQASLINIVDGDYVLLHDLIHEFSMFVSTSVHCSITKDSEDTDTRLETSGIIEEPETLRHLAGKIPRNHPKIKKLRTFICEDPHLTALNDQLRTARVLCISRGRAIQADFSNMALLRYLDLSSLEIESLPDSLCYLYNLRTLLLPREELKQFPENMWRLVNLHHLHGKYNMAEIKRIGRLRALQTSGRFQLSENYGECIKELCDLSQLRGALKIHGLNYVQNRSDAQYARLDQKEHLVELLLDMGYSNWNGSSQDDQNLRTLNREVLDNLRPHQNLQVLTVEGYIGDEFPAWTGEGYLKFMKSLTFSRCSSLLGKMPPLGLLPKLQYLRIEHCSFKRISSDIYGIEYSRSPVFPSLEELSLEHMKDLEEWEELNCDDKEQINIPYLTSLRKIKIVGCGKLRRLPPVPRSLGTLDVHNAGIAILPKVWGCCSSNDGVGSSLHTCDLQRLTYLKLDCGVVDASKWLNHMPSLSKVILDCCNLAETGSIVESPDELTVDSCVNLQFLSISYMHKLKKLVLQKLPLLKELRLFSNKDLVEVHLPSDHLLKKISLHHCGNLTTINGLRNCDIKKLNLLGTPPVCLNEYTPRSSSAPHEF